jgi:CRISPR/Cas system CMR-associated protein Cmr3 (group 5 of RAMP superfamily)
MPSKQFQLLFVHDDNKSNNGQIGQVVAMGGSGKTQDFFSCEKMSTLWSNNTTFKDVNSTIKIEAPKVLSTLWF